MSNNENLIEAKRQSYTVARFMDDDYGGIIKESVGQHIDACVAMIKGFSLPYGVDGDILIQLLELHDLPEIGSDHDDTAVAKLEEMVAVRADKREEKMAKKLFTGDQLALYDDFNRAGKWLRGKTWEQNFLPESLVAQLVDKIQGNQYFHREWSKWVMGPDYNPAFVMKHSAKTFTAVQYQQFMNTLCNYQGYEDVLVFCRGLLDEEMKTIDSYWEEVRKQGIDIVERNDL